MVSFNPYNAILSSGVTGNFVAYSNLILNGKCSALKWYNMLNNPMLGMNIHTIERTLLRLAKSPQAKITTLAVVGQNPFSVFTVFKCINMHVFKLQLIERARMVVASKPKADWLKMVSNPPVVAVFVDPNRRIRICKDTWRNTSVP